MLSTFKDRWKARSTKWGLRFKHFGTIILGLGAMATHFSNQLGLLPDGFVPQWLKYVFGVLAGISFLFGGLTVKKEG